MRFKLLVVLSAAWILAGATCLPLVDYPDRAPRPGVTLAAAISAPATSRSVPQGAAVQVKWSATNTSGKSATLRVFVEARPGLARTTLVEGIPISGAAVSDTLTWDTTSFAAAAYRIFVEVTNGELTRDAQAAGEITVNGPALFFFTSPTTDTTLPADGNITLGFTLRDPEGEGAVRLGIDLDADHSNANEIFIGEVALPDDTKADMFEWNGADEDGNAVDAGAYNLFALVDDGINPIQTVNGLARLIVTDSNANNNDNDNQSGIGIREPNTNTEFLSSRPELRIEFGVNEPTDVLVDLKVDPDNNHANGNEITILAQRLIRAGTATDTFAWNGNDSSGAAVPDGIYTLLIVVNRESGAPQTTAGDALVFRRGVATTPLSRQTWERGSAAWSLILPTDSPTARRDFGLAFDSARERAVLYGGSVGGTSNAETWEWDRANWTQRTVSGPPALDGTALAHDASRNVTVLFGGRTNGTVTNETWEWNGDAWTQRAAVGPAARFDHALAFDSIRNRVVLFGGSDSVIRNGETWEWDGNQWEARATTGPAARQGHALAFDVDRRVTVLFGGSTAFGPTAETWEWDGSSWTQRLPATSPSARADHALAFDAPRGVVVLFGGRDATGLSDETWEWDGDAWREADPATRPPARAGHALAFQSNASQSVLFGGVSTIPLVALLTPATFQTLDAGQFLTIRWRDDDPSGVARIRLTLDDDRHPAEAAETGDAEIEILSGREAARDGVSDSFSFQVPATLDPGTYFLFAYIDSDDVAPADQVSMAPGRLIIRDPANP